MPTPPSAAGALSDADMPWPKIKLAAGEEISLDQTAYTKHRAAPSRDDRKQVMDSFFGTWQTYERTVGATLYAQLEQERVVATVRKYPGRLLVSTCAAPAAARVIPVRRQQAPSAAASHV